MGFKFSIYACEDPDALAFSCETADPPLPTEPWMNRANRYRCPIGLRPGIANVLLNGLAVTRIDTSKYYPLVINDNPVNGVSTSITIKNMRVVGTPINVTPGAANGGVYLVELADRRIDCVGMANKRYNWRPYPDSAYLTATLNGGVAWTWLEILEDLWNAVGTLGTWPGLPLTSAGAAGSIPGTPDQIDATAIRASDLLEDILALNDYAVKYDPVGDTFSIVDLSIVDIGLATAQRKYSPRLIWDQYPLVETPPSLPEYCRVLFAVWASPTSNAAGDSVYAVDVQDTTAGGAKYRESGKYSIIQDPTPCRLRENSAVIDSTSLLAIAAARAAAFFYRCRNTNSLPLYQAYSGIVDASSFLPGQSIDMVEWHDFSEGPKTIIARCGRQGFAPLYKPVTPSWNTSGTILSNNMFASELWRTVAGDANPINRAASFPPSQSRIHDALGITEGDTLAAQTAGDGTGVMFGRAGPIRQADFSVIGSRSYTSAAVRMWRSWARTQLIRLVRITSLTTTGGLYPAKEVYVDPLTLTTYDGADCWYWDLNSGGGGGGGGGASDGEVMARVLGGF